MFKDRLFFFGAQEWVDFFQVPTNTATVPTEAMRRGDFSELLEPEQRLLHRRAAIIDPPTGQPFPGNIIPTNRLSPNGVAILNTYPLPTPGFRQGSANVIQNSDEPAGSAQGQHPLRLPAEQPQPVHLPLLGLQLRRAGGVPRLRSRSRGRISTGRTTRRRRAGRARSASNLINEFSYTYSRDDVFIDVFTGDGLYQRSRTGINYPYIFPEARRSTTRSRPISLRGFGNIDGGPYPASSAGPIHTFSNVTTLVRGRHTFKAGVSFEYSGEDDFDQINVNAIPGGTNNQNGRFEFLDSRAGGTGTAVSNMALGLFSNYAELGQRNFTEWRALATDVFVQDSWRPTSKLTIEGGVRWVYWPPWYSTTNNIANFDPRFYDTAEPGRDQPGHRPSHQRAALQRRRAAGRRLRG